MRLKVLILFFLLVGHDITLEYSCTKFIKLIKMNKIIVSIVFAIILVLGINKIADVIFYVEKPEKSAYQVASVSTVDNATTTKKSSTNSETENIIALFASANAKEGEKIFKKCAACHSIAEGGANKIGPALWSVLGKTSWFSSRLQIFKSNGSIWQKLVI